MAELNNSNCRVDPDTGAVIFNRSSESITLARLDKKMDTINDKLDRILMRLEGEDDRTVEK